MARIFGNRKRTCTGKKQYDIKLNQANKEKDCSMLPSRSDTDLFRRKNSHVERQFVDTLDWRCGQNSLGGGYIYVYIYIYT